VTTVPTPKRRILLIDDDARVREMLRDVITAFGYDVDVAEEGQTGHSKFKQQQIDLVITDLMMPGVNGLQLAAELRILHPTVPIILLTGFATAAAAAEARRLGLTILSKPIGGPALKAAIAAAIGG
jgi:two-component system, NtrC family, response regulator HydG